MPYVDEGTFLVGRLDVERIDADAMAEYMQQYVESMMKQQQANLPAEALEHRREQTKREAETVRTWLANMSKAGGKHVYLLMDSTDMQDRGNDDPVVVVPLTEGADAEQIRSILQPNPHPRNQCEEVGKAVVFAEPPQMARVKRRVESAAAPAERPDLAAAFAAAGDAPARLALVPGEATRAFVEEAAPALPKPLGGGEMKVLTRGLRWATVAVAQKPQMRAKLTIHASDAAQAKALLELINKATAFAEEAAAGANPRGPDAAIGEQLGEIKPALAGSDITVGPVDPMLLMNALRFGAMQGRPRPVIQPPPAAAGGANPQPVKPDDGGL